MDVDKWLKEHNELRPHSGRFCFGKTPMQTFNESKILAQEKQLDMITEVKADHHMKPDRVRQHF